MAAHSSILNWRIPWTEKPARPQPMESESGTAVSEDREWSSAYSRCSVNVRIFPLVAHCPCFMVLIFFSGFSEIIEIFFFLKFMLSYMVLSSVLHLFSLLWSFMIFELEVGDLCLLV